MHAGSASISLRVTHAACACSGAVTALAARDEYSEDMSVNLRDSQIEVSMDLARDSGACFPYCDAHSTWRHVCMQPKRGAGHVALRGRQHSRP
eukprot:2597083-Amphidinium_carterae.1